MDTRLLRTFCAVARLGSFSAAARELGYTQSAVSQHIVALESDLGVPLLTRRPVAPTDAGARLLDHAVPLLLRLDAARADVAQAANPAARLVVGVAPLAVAHLPAVARHARAAGVRDLSVRVAGPGTLPGALAAGEIDVAVLVGPVVRGDPLALPAVASLSATPLAEAQALVAVPDDHPLADSRVALADLADARWIAALDAVGSVDDLCATLGLPPLRISVRCAGTGLDAPRVLAAAGEGLVLLPESALGAGLRGIPVTDPDLVYRTEVVHRRSADPVVAAVADALVSDRRGPG